MNFPDPDEVIERFIDFTGHNYYALEVILKPYDYFDVKSRTQCIQDQN